MKCLIFAALFAVVAAGTYKATDYASEYESSVKEVDYKKQPYSFAWDVKDEDTYNDFVHSEKSDGEVITGSYRVELPDGRTQIVNYRADENGNVADVTYEGEAQYPDEKEYKTVTHVEPVYSAPAVPAYKAPTAPTYKAPTAPAYKAPTAPAYKAPTAPAYKAPTAPAYKESTAPVYKAPTAPAYKEPAYSAPAYKAPSYSAPTYRAPTYSAPAYSAPTYSVPKYKGPTYATPIFRSANKTPVYPSYPTYY